MKVAIVVFPGSNCDADTQWVLGNVLGNECRLLWHKEGSVGDTDLVIVPGGFSYGDYLRTGAIARFSPIMTDVVRFAETGGHVLGICNGFQILTESGLLPGTLMTNHKLRFLCHDVDLRVEHTDSAFTAACSQGEVLRMPIAHHGGCFYASESTLDELEEHHQILLKYCDPDGAVTADSNPNGSCRNIAGIRNQRANVMGLMPHPERNAESVLGDGRGRRLFDSLMQSLGAEVPQN